MAWELGFIADYITCRAVLQVESVTLLFDATTQEGLHINCVILCTQNLSYLVSLEHLPGGTASDYKQHICNSIKRLVEAYCQVSGETFDDCLRCLVGKICCTLTDRAPVNHATVRLLEEEWGKKMVEMNCNLHPLEAASRATKKILFQMETEEEKNIIPGGECLAWKIILSLNQLRFSPRKGDIMDFANFWQQKGVKKSDIPRLHGNRLNIIFHLGGIYYTHFQEIKKFIKKYKCPNDLQLNLQRAMEPQTAAVELRVMGAIGKLLTGPWMQVFYTKENCNHSAHTYMSIIKNVFNNIRICIQQPEFIFHYRHDLFGQPLNKEDNEITKNVLMAPGDAIFLDKFKACLEQISIAIGNQYSKTFETVAQNSDEVMSSAREHTMVAESIIGEFCAHKKTAPNASVDTICNLIKSKRNGVLEFINDASKSLYCRLLDLALPYGRNACTEAIEKRKATSAEIQAREERRRSENEAKYRRRLQNTLKNLSNYSTDTLQQALPNTSTDRLISLQGILLRTPESRSIEHYWEVDGVLEKYYGKIRRNLLEDYVIFYYKLDEYEVGVEENIPVVELAADFLCEDMSFC